MMFPLVLDLAADNIAVAVTCRVLGFSKQAFYQWRANPVSQRDWDDAHLINAAREIHHDDPEFGYRLITDELTRARHRGQPQPGQPVCTQERIFSNHAKKRGLSRKPGPPVHDDLVERLFTADTPNRLWLTDITEHPTGEGKLYLCAVKEGRLHQPDRRLLHGRADDLTAGRGRPHQRRRPAPTLRPGPARGRPARVDGPGRGLRGQRGDGVFFSLCRRTS